MSNRGAIIRFCTSALCVALFFTYISVKGLSVSDNIYIQTQAPVLDNTDPSQTVSEQSVLTQAQSQSQSTSNSAPLIKILFTSVSLVIPEGSVRLLKIVLS